MPQMAPISWLTLFLVFSLTLILFGILNYYLFTPNSPSSLNEKTQIKTNPLNWPW
uniref:ATP synthase F0 subunit 8 n=1 Tax=Hexagenia rigida TaxID=197160 RepID=UPI001FCDF5D6|nr:ATP synthase F0 subunit 8 [Hexagenia rigida]UNH92446.1 ATP synthase F0 subunit 8 [Hexagenia rigida]